MGFQRLHLPVVLIFVLVGILCVVTTEGGRGGGGGGGGGRGGGGGARGGFGRSGGGKSSGKISTRKKVGLLAGGGVASYAAYRGYKASHPKNKDKDSPDFDTDEGQATFQVQERTGYSRGEGFGMSALGLILFILGLLGVGFLIWCCYNVGAPFWQDRQSKRNRTMDFGHIVNTKGNDDDIPLRETPSTATPSPK